MPILVDKLNQHEPLYEITSALHSSVFITLEFILITQIRNFLTFNNFNNLRIFNIQNFI